MIFRSPRVAADEFERATGWAFKPEGLCKDAVCVPFSAPNGWIDVRDVSTALRMPLVESGDVPLWALGPPSGGRALASAVAPDLELPDLDGRAFSLASLRGWKVLLLAWAPW